MRLCVSRPLANPQCDLGCRIVDFFYSVFATEVAAPSRMFQSGRNGHFSTDHFGISFLRHFESESNAAGKVVEGPRKEERRVCLHAPLGRMCWCVLKFADAATHSSRRASAKLLSKVHMPTSDAGLDLRFPGLLSAAVRTKDSSFRNVTSILGASVGAPMNNGWGSL
jgi:hypothetical protein